MTSVLIVDDNESIRNLISNYFRAQSRFRIVGDASDGEEGIAKALALRPDLIILDLSMPKKGGVKTAAQIKELIPGVAIILFTIHDTSSRDFALRGIDAVVSKSEGLQKLAAEAGRIANGVPSSHCH